MRLCTSSPARVAALSALLLALAATWSAPRAAHANPWVVPKDVRVLTLTGGADFADEEFLPDGTQQAFPLNGRFDSYFLDIGARYGLLDGVEINGSVQFKGVSYISDPFLAIPDPLPDEPVGYRDNILNFSQRGLGVADLYLGGVYQHVNGPVWLSSSISLQIPTGYTPPEQTFAEGTPSPENLADDVTLGDGKFEAEYELHFGAFINATGTLIQASAGYEARFNGPGHRATGLLKVGQRIDQRFFLFAEADSAFTLFDGAVIGQTFIAIDPTIPARDFTGDNIRAIDISLDRDFVTLRGGALFRFTKREVVFSVSRTVWGANFPVLTGATLGTILAFD